MIQLHRTCDAYPEQYDAYKDGKYVGYFRLRHGIFTVEDADLTCYIFSGVPNGDGQFEDDERDQWLRRGCLALERHSMGLKEPEILKNYELIDKAPSD
jgi:hypothetical protein